MNPHSSCRQSGSVVAATALTLLLATAITACSPKPSADASAAQTKAVVDQAVAEAKKEMQAEQAANKDKQDAAIAQAVANAKKDFETEQRASEEKMKKQRLAEQRAIEEKAVAHNNSSNQPAVTVSECTRCGVVISVNEVEAEGKGSGLGVVAGGVVGGVLGNQIGGGSGRDLATIAGAVGGAFAGNKIEKIAKKTRSYEIVVKMNSGEERTFKQSSVPNVERGDKIRIENGMVVRR